MKRMFACFCFAVLFFSITAVSAMADINDDLYSAVNSNNVQAVKDLLANGANPNARCKNWAGKRDFTPLYAAAEEGNAEIVLLLLDKGGDVNAKCPMGMTPLMTAAEHGKKDVIPLLLGKNADVNAKDTSGETALLFAVESNVTDNSDTAIVNALLDQWRRSQSGKRRLDAAYVCCSTQQTRNRKAAHCQRRGCQCRQGRQYPS